MATRFLLYAPKMKALAERICAKNSGIIPMPVAWRRFPDRFPDTFIADKERPFGAHVSFLACLDTPETFAKVAGTAPFEVLSLDDSIARAVML